MCTKFIHPTDVIQIMCTLCLQKVYKYTSILIKETILYYTKVLVQCMLWLVEREKEKVVWLSVIFISTINLEAAHYVGSK